MPRKMSGSEGSALSPVEMMSWTQVSTWKKVMRTSRPQGETGRSCRARRSRRACFSSGETGSSQAGISAKAISSPKATGSGSSAGAVRPRT